MKHYDGPGYGWALGRSSWICGLCREHGPQIKELAGVHNAEVTRQLIAGSTKHYKEVHGIDLIKGMMP